MITLYVTSVCPYCKMVQKLLDNKGAKYEIVNVENDIDLQRKLSTETGRNRVPVTKIGDKYISGWKPTQIMELV